MDTNKYFASGAGYGSIVNDIYLPLDDYHGATRYLPYYAGSAVQLFVDDGTYGHSGDWVITYDNGDDIICLYYNTDYNGGFPPLSGWLVDAGSSPAPTFVIPPEPTPLTVADAGTPDAIGDYDPVPGEYSAGHPVLQNPAGFYIKWDVSEDAWVFWFDSNPYYKSTATSYLAPSTGWSVFGGGDEPPPSMAYELSAVQTGPNQITFDIAGSPPLWIATAGLVLHVQQYNSPDYVHFDINGLPLDGYTFPMVVDLDTDHLDSADQYAVYFYVYNQDPPNEEIDLILPDDWFQMDPGSGDTTPPAFLTASVDPSGLILSLTLTEDDTPPVLPASGITGFIVEVNDLNRSYTIEQIEESGEYALTLSPGVYSTDTVTISYAAGNVTDSADPPNEMESFANEVVANNSMQVPDTTRPVVASAGVTSDGLHLIVNFTEADSMPLLPEDGGEIDGISIVSDLDGYPHTTSNGVWTDENTLAFDISPVVLARENLLLVVAEGAVTDSADEPNEIQGISDGAITNASEVTLPYIGGATAKGFGEIIAVSWEDVVGQISGDSGFTLTNIDPAVSVIGMEHDGDRTTLLLSRPLIDADGETLYDTEALLNYTPGNIEDDGTDPPGEPLEQLEIPIVFAVPGPPWHHSDDRPTYGQMWPRGGL